MQKPMSIIMSSESNGRKALEVVRSVVFGIWHIFRRRCLPVVAIVSAVAAGVIAAVLVRTFLVQITNALISVLHWTSGQLAQVIPALRNHPVKLDAIDPNASGFDYGVGAFGAAFLLTKVQEVISSVSALFKH